MGGVRFEPEDPYWFLGLYDTEDDRTITVEDGRQVPVGEPSFAGELLIYPIRLTGTGSDFQKLIKYSTASGAKTELSNHKVPKYQYSFGDDVVYFTGDNSSVVMHYSLLTDSENQLPIPFTMKVPCCGMYGRRFVWIDDTANGTAVMLFDLDKNAVTQVYPSIYNQWDPVIWSNLVTWVDYSVSQGSVGSPGHVMILDLDTGARRQITKIAASYYQIISGKYLVVTDNSTAVYSAFYLYDLETNGIIKDGHVVNEASQ